MRFASVVMILTFTLTACAPSHAGRSASGNQTASPGASTGVKSMVAAINEDPGNFWDGITGGGGSGARELGHMVNQYLVALAPDAQPQPRLLAELPSQDNGTWRVLPDGRMETTWKLRSDVLWHDGTPFTAEDIVFSILVNRDPDVPNGNQAAAKLIEKAEAIDPTTVVTTWRDLYPFADRLEHRELIPLPRHILERSYREAKDTLLLQPYFSTEYVGLGPYKVARWEHGSHLDLVANEHYFLGKPKIDNIRIQFIADENAMLANLRAGSLNLVLPPGGPEFDQIMDLKREWDTSRQGTVITESVRWTFIDVQKNRTTQPAELADPRVRQALFYAIDRPELARAILAEFGVVADSWVHPDYPVFKIVQPSIKKYDYDPRRASALLAEAGWRPGPDGMLEKSGAKFNVGLRYRTEERDAIVIREAFKAIGVTAELQFLSDQLLRDRQQRATFTGLDITNNPMGGLSAVRRFITEAVPTAENRWTGTNRGSYANPAWDALGERLRVTLSERERDDIERQLVDVFTTDLPALPLYYEGQALPLGHGLTGVQPTRGVAHTGHVMHTGNVHLWEMTR
jgi:peptide/nickel transport system substrate-binding protein